MKWRGFLIMCILATLLTACDVAENMSQFPLSESENKKECRLCGSKRPDAWDYYEEKGGLVLLCLNSWNIGEIALENDEDESNEYFTVNEDANGVDRCRWVIRSNPAQHECNIEIYYGKKSVLDLKELKKQLCRECYDKILKDILESGPTIKQYCSVLMDMETGEIYPISSDTEYYVRDFQVQIEHKKGKNEADIQIQICKKQK